MVSEAPRPQPGGDEDGSAVEQELYEVRKKIHPRSVTGVFAGLRWGLMWATQIVCYGLPWLEWNDRQAVLFDLVRRKFYIFGLVFWPQDFIFLSGLLIIAALSLFLFTAIAGRLWCGYACPQTVYTEIFLWIERAIEGERTQRQLDQQPMNAGKLAKPSAKHGLWIALSLPGKFSRPDLDLLIVRENTEGLYAGRERREGDTAIAERVITRAGSMRIARMAFEQARKRIPPSHRGASQSAFNRQYSVAVVHKANVLKITDGLFRECALQVAQDYPEIVVKEVLIDAMAMRLVRDPENFDVIVTTNLFGDILSDEASALIGGLGVAPSANIGEAVAVFEPVHVSAPDIAGQGVANPIGAILSAALLLHHVGQAVQACGRY